jgi:ClpP class serine protease
MWLDDAVAQAAGGGWRPYAMHGSVAVIGVMGLIVPSLGWIGSDWATGNAELRWQVETAAADPAVAAIALYVDSGGGVVSGTPETAAAIRAARAVKPVAAVCANAASAAYWIASQADTLAAAPTACVGHIGIMAEHWDDTEALGRWGVKRTVFTAGARKGDLYPALTPEGAAAVQAEIDGLRRLFAEDVAAGRGLDPAAALATEAQAYAGPDGPTGLPGALAAGLIDAVMHPGDALEAFAAALTAGPAPA